MTAVAWLWFGDGINDWFTHLSKGFLIGVPILVFGYQTLVESGRPVMRRAHGLAQRLADRHDWPTDLSAVPHASRGEGVSRHAGIRRRPGPGDVAACTRMEVRVAALAALEFRKDWRPGQAELVMQIAQRSEEPAVRAAAVLALGNLEDRVMIETLAQFLNDPNREVRRAAVEGAVVGLRASLELDSLCHSPHACRTRSSRTTARCFPKANS